MSGHNRLLYDATIGENTALLDGSTSDFAGVLPVRHTHSPEFVLAQCAVVPYLPASSSMLNGVDMLLPAKKSTITKKQPAIVKLGQK
ncbi:MAG: hypothetical protein AB8B97_25975 [Granulosicoccus sp.]